MKKFASLLGAGALMLSTATVAFAGGPSWGTGTTQGNYGTKTVVVSVAGSNSGLNHQMGSGNQTMTTGNSTAQSGITSVANQNGNNKMNGQSSHHSNGKISQGNYGNETFVMSGVASNTGMNMQVGTSQTNNNYHHGHHSSSSSQTQTMTTGTSGASSWVDSWANINLNGVELQ